MQASSPERGHARHRPLTPHRLKLSMPSLVRQTPPNHGLALDTSMTSDILFDPARPAWSPLTPSPTLSHAEILEPEQPPQDTPTAIPEPEVAPQSLSLDGNPDAIALRTAISILQIQRQQSIKDLQSLERLKQAALDDPQGFLGELRDNKLTQPARPGVFVDVDDEDQDGDAEVGTRSKFGAIPQAQNVVRCPPINWEKYHIVGESLDRLHEQQRRYPGVTDEQIQRSGHPPKHTIAAPYRPGIDKLEQKVTTSQGKFQ